MLIFLHSINFGKYWVIDTMMKQLLVSIVVLVWLITPVVAEDARRAVGVGPYTALLRTPSGGFTTQAYMDVQGLAIAEGDIVLGQHADVQKETLSNLREMAHGSDATAAGIDPKNLDAMVPMSLPATGLGMMHPFSLGLSKLWPNKTVPFDVDSAIGPAQTASVLQAAKIWNAIGIVTFKRVTSTQPAADVLHVLSAGPGTSGICATSQPGHNAENKTFLSPDCSTYQIVHEFGHVLGLRHEQSRTDRNTYLAVDTSKIMDRYKPNFDSQPGNFNGTAYDPCSIMQYGNVVPGEWTITGHDELWFTLAAKGKTAFAACVKTLPHRPECRVVGQRCAISPTDKAGVAAMYR